MIVSSHDESNDSYDFQKDQQLLHQTILSNITIQFNTSNSLGKDCDFRLPYKYHLHYFIQYFEE